MNERLGRPLYQVTPGRITRDEMNALRAECEMEPCTLNYSEDVPDDLYKDPMAQAIWDEIKTWDINVPTEYAGYCGATGSHVYAIYKAIQNATKK